MNRLPDPPGETPGLYGQDGKGHDALVYAHYWLGGADWYVTEFDPETGDCFGWAELLPGCGELGYFSLQDLEGARRRMVVNVAGHQVHTWVGVEYERGWKPKRLRDVLEARAAGV